MLASWRCVRGAQPRSMWMRAWGACLLALSASASQVHLPPRGRPTHAPSVPAWTLRRIIDSNTPIPGFGGTFQFDPYYRNRCPVAAGADVVFIGAAAIGGWQAVGVYRWSAGVLSVVADRTTGLPGYPPGTTMIDFESCAASGGRAAFTYMSPYVAANGAFEVSGAGAGPLVTETTPIPGMPGMTFQAYSLALYGTGLSADSQQIAFTAYHPIFPIDGVYAEQAGVVRLLADVFTPIPGGLGTFATLHNPVGFNHPAAAGGKVLFWGQGQSGSSGLYLWDGAATSVVFDASTPTPGGPAGAQYSPIGEYDFDGTSAIFTASGYPSVGDTIWMGSSSGVAALFAPWQFIPATNGVLDGAPGGVSIDAGRFAVEVVSAGRQWILSDVKGPVAAILASGDVIEGKVVNWVRLHDQGLDQGHVAFAVGFTDGTWAFYAAE